MHRKELISRRRHTKLSWRAILGEKERGSDEDVERCGRAEAGEVKNVRKPEGDVVVLLFTLLDSGSVGKPILKSDLFGAGQHTNVQVFQ